MVQGPHEMDLYVLRHGLAEDRNYQKYPDDRERPLTRKGMARLARQVKGMNSLRITPEVVVSSPLTRAMQTAEIVLDGLSANCRLEVSDALAPSAYPQDIIDEMARTSLLTRQRDGRRSRTASEQPCFAGVVWLS